MGLRVIDYIVLFGTMVILLLKYPIYMCVFFSFCTHTHKIVKIVFLHQRTLGPALEVLIDTAILPWKF